jgi:hypothetical protein
MWTCLVGVVASENCESGPGYWFTQMALHTAKVLEVESLDQLEALLQSIAWNSTHCGHASATLWAQKSQK